MILDNKELIKGILLYLIGVISLLPGFLIGDLVLIPWYLIIIILTASSKREWVITLYIIWIFLGPGAWHYHLLGPSRESFLFKHIDELFIVAFFSLYFLKSRKNNKNLMKYNYLGLIFVFVILFSAIANNVNTINLINYFTSNNLRWFILLFIFSSLNFSEKFLHKQVLLIFSIVLFNSFFGLMQSTILPSQMEPNGYLPSQTDVASGLTGLTNAPRLSVLCIGFSVLPMLLAIKKKSTSNIILVSLILLQVITTDSRSVVIFGVLLYTLLFTYLIIIRPMKINIRNYSRIFALFSLLIIFGLIYNNYSTRYYDSRILQRTNQWINSKENLDDFGKFMGYKIAIYDIAPKGYLGKYFGVGPTKFVSTIGQKKGNTLIKKSGFMSDLSSASMMKTDFSTIIGELGLFGSITFLFILIYFVYSSFTRIKKGYSDYNKIFTIFLAFWLSLMVLMSIYTEGWLWNQFAIVSIILIIYDVKINTKLQQFL